MKLNFKIMDYKEKYENGLECIQEILSGAGDLIRISTLRNRLQPFFPELQENKDDRIRNGLIKAVSGILKGNTLYGTDVTREEALAWLEKQEQEPKKVSIWKHWKNGIAGNGEGRQVYLIKTGNTYDLSSCLGFECDYIELSELDDLMLEKQDKHLKNYDEAEKEKTDFVSGQFIECRKSFNEFKEDNSYWFEYVGDDIYIGRSDNILNQKFHITPRQLYRLFSQQHSPKEDSNVNDEANAPTEYGKYVDECLNEASKHFFSNGEDKYSVADLFYAGVRCGRLEKQGEQTNKINLQKITFEDVLALECAMKTVKITKGGNKLYEMLVLLYNKIHNAYLVEKQGEQKSQGKLALEAANEEKVDNQNCVKPAYKVEAEFHEGDWIVLNETVYQITEIDDSHVVLSFNGRECKFGLDVLNNAQKFESQFKVGDWIIAIDNEGNKTIEKIIEFCGDKVRLVDADGYYTLWPQHELNYYHLWAITDAKDGDVLVNGSNIFIFHFINGTRLMGHCHVNTDDGRYYDDVGKSECFCTIDAEVTPATKEQCDLLFSKMKEAGYEWDAEKKELKMIKQKFRVGNYIVPDNITSLEIWKVINIDEDGFYNIQPITNIINTEDNEIYRVPGFILEKDYRLWSINDAKDGDVLVNGSNIFIFHYIHGTCLMGYCHVNTDDGRYYDDIGRNECFGFIDAPVTPVKPATKEQRNLLFQKMKEAGYEWDAENKELKRLR